MKLRITVVLCLLASGSGRSLTAGSAKMTIENAAGRVQATPEHVVSAEQQPGKDLGAKIAAADSALGSSAGEIRITSPGDVSDKVTLSERHNLVCADRDVRVNLVTPRAGFVQAKDTVVQGCTLVSALTNAGPAIFSQGTSNVTAEDLTFVGGGYHIEYNMVSNFTIKNSRHVSITVAGASPILVDSSTHGQIISPQIDAFRVPAANTGVRLIAVKQSSFVDIVQPVIRGVDASTVPGCGGVSFTASTNSTLQGGTITGLTNCDGVLTESIGAKPSSEIKITQTISTGHNAVPGAGQNSNNGEGFDIFNSRLVRLSKVTAENDGTLSTNHQPGIEVSNSSEVTIDGAVSNGNGNEGIKVDGSPGVTITASHIDRNGGAGILVMPAVGKVRVIKGSPMVHWTPGSANVTFSAVWHPQTKIVIGGGVYTVLNFESTTDLTLAEQFDKPSGTYAYNVDSYVDISGGEASDNGQRHIGQPADQGVGEREGLYFAGGLTGQVIGRVAGLRAGNEQSRKTQTYGIRIENKARIVGKGVKASGNLVGGVRDSPGRSTIRKVIR